MGTKNNSTRTPVTTHERMGGKMPSVEKAVPATTKHGSGKKNGSK